MKKMKLLFTCLLLTTFATAYAQQPGKLTFEKQMHNFGEIAEEDGPVSVTFAFKNEGQGEISLTSVKASCGCTTPEWTQDPVAPGGTGFVKAVYNPRNRPGDFHKSVTVRTDGQPQVVVLRIEGKVKPRPKGPADWYPVESGNLRFKTSHIAFGEVMHDGTDTASIEIYNQGNNPITLNLKETMIPAALEASLSDQVVQPKKTVTMSFTFDAQQKQDWGYVFGYFKLKTDDTETPEKRMNYSANIKENFTSLTADAPRPKVAFDKVEHHFGEIDQNTRVTTSFNITNEGDAPLIIRKTKASCGCTASRPDKTTLAPGESTELKVTFSSGSRKGKQKKSITVICNDPEQDMTRLWIEAEVDPAEENGK